MNRILIIIRAFMLALMLICGLPGWLAARAEINSCLSRMQPDTVITLILELDKPCTSFVLEPAALRYNKDLAWSFTLDDGLISAWLVAFPYFAGGRVSPSYIDQWGYDQGGDDRNYPGLYCTDGCGHRRPFQAALAINAGNIAAEGRTDHPGSIDTVERTDHPGYLSWGQIGELCKAGWAIFNHGYAHSTGEGVDVDNEVSRNNDSIIQHLGIYPNQFVAPGGKGDSISDGPYMRAALRRGMLTAHCGHFRVSREIPGGGGAIMTGLAGREFLSSRIMEQDGWDSAYFGSVSDQLHKGKKVWVNAFTHGVGKDDIWGISLRYPVFRAFFDQLAARYGEKGQDNLWMASYQAVQEYLIIRHFEKYTVRRSGRRIIIRIDTSHLPAGLRYKAGSFVWKADQPVRRVSCQGCIVESFSPGNKGGKVQQVINIQW